MAGWIATAADAARVGQLVLDEGRRGGVPLIAPTFMREMVAQSQPFNATAGLLWWRHARHTTLVVDPAGLDTLATVGVRAGLLDKLRPLAGTHHADGDTLRTALADVLGTNLEAFGHDLDARGLALDALLRVESGPIDAYAAEGHLGQYIVVVPSARLVAVRQIAERQMPDDKPWPYSYGEFSSHVLELAQALRAP
jgi:CubicO group peptidase (beta-lactamase class C family)